MVNLNELSLENLEKIQKVLKIVLDTIELQGINKLTSNRIPLKNFEKEGLCYDEIRAVFYGIDREKNIIILTNEELKEKWEKIKRNTSIGFDYSSLNLVERKKEVLKQFHGVLPEDLENYLFFEVKNLNKLKEIKEEIDDKLRKSAKAYIEEMKRQLKEEERVREIVKEEQKKIEMPRLEKRKNLINRDKITGDFYFKNKLIKFENKEAIYYLIFECLYEKGDLNGFCSYETINKYLEKQGKEEYIDDRQIKDRIKNGILNLFRFSNLPPKAPDSNEIIQKVRGKGIILYNPSF